MFGEKEKEIKNYIRGVNIGGWLVLENFITPYLYALNTCDLKGDFRFREGQIDAPPVTSPLYKPVDREECPSIPRDDYPADEWSMMQLFRDANNGDSSIAEQYLDIHYNNMVKREDITELKAGGVTHVRVTLSHWILGDIEGDEPYVEGGWKYFKRLVRWCREEGIEVWPDLHTAPGSQNGFDNSGHMSFENGKTTCHGWDNNATDSYLNTTGGVLPYNVRRTLRIIDQITSRFVTDGLRDVVTGFGLLNEPFGNCNNVILKDFYNQGLDIVRKNMGNDTGIYISDAMYPWGWNGGFWAGEEYKGTYLDSHFYQVFDPNARHASPRQHIALVCERDHRTATSCCEVDGKPDKGMGRISTEWSGAFDKDVSIQIPLLMDYIHGTGGAFDLHRTLGEPRQAFLRNYLEAQIVNFETSSFSGWFFWNFKIEGGYCAEWDFLRGLREGWVPKLPAPDVSSVDVYGSCFDILFRTDDNIFPDTPPDIDGWFNDDVVNSHGKDMRKVFGKWYEKDNTFKVKYQDMWVAAFFLVAGFIVYSRMKRHKQSAYTKIPESPEPTVHMLTGDDLF